MAVPITSEMSLAIALSSVSGQYYVRLCYPRNPAANGGHKLRHLVWHRNQPPRNLGGDDQIYCVKPRSEAAPTRTGSGLKRLHRGQPGQSDTGALPEPGEEQVHG